MSRLLLIIPAYNEADSIVRVIGELRELGTAADYIIINDGSKDATEQICREQGYHFISLPVNVGLSGGFHTGMKYAARHGYAMAMQYDGDGQHDPHYIHTLVEKMTQTGADIVIGSRFLQERKHFSLRTAGNQLIQFLIRLTTGHRITDPTSGMRLYNRAMLELFSREINLPPEPDTIAYLSRCGYHIEEVQVGMRERQAGKSYLNVGNALRYMFNMGISIVFIQFFRKNMREKEVSSS